MVGVRKIPRIGEVHVHEQIFSGIKSAHTLQICNQMLIECFCMFLYKMIVHTVIMTHFFACCEATVNANCTAVYIS